MKVKELIKNDAKNSEITQRDFTEKYGVSKARIERARMNGKIKFRAHSNGYWKFYNEKELVKYFLK